MGRKTKRLNGAVSDSGFTTDGESSLNLKNKKYRKKKKSRPQSATSRLGSAAGETTLLNPSTMSEGQTTPKVTVSQDDNFVALKRVNELSAQMKSLVTFDQMKELIGEMKQSIVSAMTEKMDTLEGRISDLEAENNSLRDGAVLQTDTGGQNTSHVSHKRPRTAKGRKGKK